LQKGGRRVEIGEEGFENIFTIRRGGVKKKSGTGTDTRRLGLGEGRAVGRREGVEEYGNGANL